MTPRGRAERFVFQVCVEGARASDLASGWPPGQMVCPRALRLAWSDYGWGPKRGTGGHRSLGERAAKVWGMLLKFVLTHNRMVQREEFGLYDAFGWDEAEAVEG